MFAASGPCGFTLIYALLDSPGEDRSPGPAYWSRSWSSVRFFWGAWRIRSRATRSNVIQLLYSELHFCFHNS